MNRLPLVPWLPGAYVAQVCSPTAQACKEQARRHEGGTNKKRCISPTSTKRNPSKIEVKASSFYSISFGINRHISKVY
jgi:hypothetical protein